MKRKLYTYTIPQALAAGDLMDVSGIAAISGLEPRVVVTKNLFNKYIETSKNGLLNTLDAVSKVKGNSRAGLFAFKVKYENRDGIFSDTQVWADIQGLPDGSQVTTIMLQEDY